MLARLRKAVEENEEGFTLIELLVVMIIIGILAAIAIPVFLNQRKKAVDSSMKSDLRTIANTMETVYTDKNTYSGIAPTDKKTGTFQIGSTDVTLSNGNAATIVAGVNSFCVQVVRGDSASASSFGDKSTSEGWVYKSDAGGIQPEDTKHCPPTMS